MALKTTSTQILGIIGARSGSIQLPNKNIKEFSGKPLMAWIIQAAKRSQYVSRLLVSTDSPEYAEIAKHYGAEVPFLRPPEISGSEATDFQYIKHAIDWLNEHEGYVPEYFLRLLPTTPLQNTQDIDNSIIELLSRPDLESVMVIAEARQHPEKALAIVTEPDGSKYLKSYTQGNKKNISPGLRQEYKKAYFRGNVVLSRREVIDTYENIAGDKVGYTIIDAHRAIDIDNLVDFQVAEAIHDLINTSNA